MLYIYITYYYSVIKKSYGHTNKMVTSEGN